MAPSSTELKTAGPHALRCFVFSALLFGAVHASSLILGGTSQIWALEFWGPALYFCLMNFGLRYCYRGFTYEVSMRAAFLGCAFATGLYATFLPGWFTFGTYAAVLSFFHFSEFYVIARINCSSLTLDSFILNHSVQYGVAAVSSWFEWGLEYYYFPGLKQYWWISYTGLLLCVGGEVLRKGAIITARTNFNHIVQNVKQDDHTLVTHGVYAWCRHPSYVGWFYWSIGTQLILVNPICVFFYALASWSFFNERVFAEEYTLLQFFGPEYEEYQRKVGTGLPGIHGYVTM